ncbi:RING finger and transmembrane domain-containing protein 2 [Phytophthora cinnamomi]|uniref:RING finger and transmembrane domain-containing protein 2 n=1 Tax=Phytophthora cinnamomi TaxID=4785 RepID=UPI00355A5E99|nr:RING finger and transmembrane domain-containing protein 2 [Phytophthora cinnamomi]
MAQRGDADSGGDSDSGHHTGATAANPVVETQAMTSAPVASSQTSSASRDDRLNVNVLEAPPALYDALPRPHGVVQRSTSDVEAERRTPYDPALRGLVGRSNSASFDPEHVPEDAELLRQRQLAAALSTPVSGDAVSSRLLQALPQLAIGQFLQDFNNQTPSWRNFAAAGRQNSTASAENAAEESETGRLLPGEPATGEGTQGSPPRSRRRGSSVASMYSMSAAGELERSDSGGPRPPGALDAESAPVARPTARGGSGVRSRRSSEDESEDQTALEELQALFRRCHNSLPFVALFLIYFAYQHATGILVFVVGTVAVMGLDQRVRAQVALKDKASNWHLLGIVAMCAIDMVAICSVDGQPNPLRHFSQMLQSRSTHGSGSDSGLLSTGGVFWQVLWTVLVNDFLVRLWSIVAKTFVAGAKSDRFLCRRKNHAEATTNLDESPVTVNAGEDDDDSTTITPLTQQAVSTVAFYRRKRKLYGIIEMCSIFVRSLLASIPWCSFYQLCASKFMADVFTFGYLFIKGLILATQGRRIFILTRSLVTLGLEFGVYVTHDELVEAGSPDCSICYETMRQPVKLACSHMFCEECVTEWFDHERSCPLCRASVGSGPSEDENVKPQFLDGRTSLVPQLL